MLLNSVEIYENCYKPINYLIGLIIKRIENTGKYTKDQLDQGRADLVRRFDYNQRRRNLESLAKDNIDFHVKETLRFYKVSRTEKNWEKAQSKNA